MNDSILIKDLIVWCFSGNQGDCFKNSLNFTFGFLIQLYHWNFFFFFLLLFSIISFFSLWMSWVYNKLTRILYTLSQMEMDKKEYLRENSIVFSYFLTVTRVFYLYFQFRRWTFIHTYTTETVCETMFQRKPSSRQYKNYMKHLINRVFIIELLTGMNIKMSWVVDRIHFLYSIILLC